MRGAISNIAALLLLSCSTIYADLNGTAESATSTTATPGEVPDLQSCENADTTRTVAGDGDDEHEHEHKHELGDDTARMEEFLTYWDTFHEVFEPYGRLVSLYGITEQMKCHIATATFDENPNPFSAIPTDTDYALLVEAYVYATNKNPDPRGRPPTVTKYNPKSFSVPVEVRVVPHVGRGVFVLEDVAKGTEVNRPTNALEFYSKDVFRDFLAYLVKKRSRLFCDIFLWLYAARYSPDDDRDYIVCLDADHSTLINSWDWSDADDDDDDDDDAVIDEEEEDDQNWYEDDDEVVDDEEDDYSKLNIGSVFKVGSRLYGCQEPPIIALRDIKAGEEFRMSYGDFSEPEGFWYMGISHSSE